MKTKFGTMVRDVELLRVVGEYGVRETNNVKIS